MKVAYKLLEDVIEVNLGEGRAHNVTRTRLNCGSPSVWAFGGCFTRLSS